MRAGVKKTQQYMLSIGLRHYGHQSKYNIYNIFYICLASFNLSNKIIYAAGSHFLVGLQ